jgi:predicted amidohydrolase YtcJ
MAHRAGRQIAFHAIGDAMLERVLRAVEKLDNPQKLRHRVIHCMIGDNAQYTLIYQTWVDGKPVYQQK